MHGKATAEFGRGILRTPLFRCVKNKVDVVALFLRVNRNVDDEIARLSEERMSDWGKTKPPTNGRPGIAGGLHFDRTSFRSGAILADRRPNRDVSRMVDVLHVEIAGRSGSSSSETGALSELELEMSPI